MYVSPVGNEGAFHHCIVDARQTVTIVASLNGYVDPDELCRAVH
jgi:hypothetical protein